MWLFTLMGYVVTKGNGAAYVSSEWHIEHTDWWSGVGIMLALAVLFVRCRNNERVEEKVWLLSLHNSRTVSWVSLCYLPYPFLPHNLQSVACRVCSNSLSKCGGFANTSDVCCVLSVTERNDRFESITDTYQAVSQLPQPNRDTMAYLILHLQRSVYVVPVFSAAICYQFSGMAFVTLGPIHCA